MTTEPEVWRPIPSADKYEASNLGRVRSLRRKEPHPLLSTPGPCGFNTVTVSALIPGGMCRRIGSLVALAWIGPRPKGSEVRRLDGDPLNDRADNLAYGTTEQVAADHEARARREETAGAPTHCPEGHRYADSWLGNWGQRLCPECRKGRSPRAEYNHRYYLNHRTPKFPRETPCEGCGVMVPRPLHYCDPCRDIADRENAARYRAKSSKPPRGSRCIDCGALILNRGPGPLAQRCKPHKMLAARAAGRRFDNRSKEMTS